MQRLNYTAIAILFLAASILCENETGKSCTTNSDCKGPIYICTDDDTCQHKPLWPPTLIEIIGIVVIVLISMLAAASGIGGGQILVPLSIILLQFEAKQAIALSNGIILCNGLVKTIVGICRKHPTIKSKTLIDYNIVLILMPTILLGSFIGAIIGEMMPNQL